MPLPAIEPPVVNSANPWATTIDDLQTLFDCEYTGAVTTRTSLLHGFEHDDAVHQYAFFDARDHVVPSDGIEPPKNVGSINTLGYSPLRLTTYLTMIAKIVEDSKLAPVIRTRKPFIISVTGSAEAVAECYEKIQAAQLTLSNPLCMEVNLSCPNIPDKPPPAYSPGTSLKEYLAKLSAGRSSDGGMRCPIGIKTPPYTYHDQFKTLVDALLDSCNPTCPIDFITATNTLGSSLILDDAKGLPAVNSTSGAGIGGLAGAPIHPLALGNVKTLRQMLDQHHQLKGIDIIGVGGVGDSDGFLRMKAVGAKVIGIGTALGNEGVVIFEKIYSRLIAAN